VPALADIQLFFRNAVVTGDVAGIRPLLSDGADPENGLGIHRRNYEVSLMTALLTKRCNEIRPTANAVKMVT
jgi:hypothetical protein